MKRVALETFIALADLRHFGRVAERLNTTQSNISARIAALEQELGVALFHRDPSGVTLTPKGRELLGHAFEIVGGMDRLVQAVASDPTRGGTLRLGVSETLVSTLLPGFFRAFGERFPAAVLQIVVHNSGYQRDQLVDHGLDLALLMGPVSHPRIANVPLIEFPMIWVVGAEHPLAEEGTASLEELSSGPILTYTTHSRPYVELVERLREAGVAAPRLFTSNALGASMAITQAGLAVCTAPRVFAERHIAEGVLVELRTPIPLSPLLFTASYRSEAGNEQAREAAEIAATVARRLGDAQSKNSIELQQKAELD